MSSVPQISTASQELWQPPPSPQLPSLSPPSPPQPFIPQKRRLEGNEEGEGRPPKRQSFATHSFSGSFSNILSEMCDSPQIIGVKRPLGTADDDEVEEQPAKGRRLTTSTLVTPLQPRPTIPTSNFTTTQPLPPSPSSLFSPSPSPSPPPKAGPSNWRKYYPESSDEDASSDEEDDAHLIAPIRPRRLPIPPPSSEQPRFSKYVVDADHPEAGPVLMCEAPPITGKRRRDQMDNDSMVDEYLAVKRELPGVPFSDSQVLYGIVCANTIGRVSTKRRQAIQFAPLSRADQRYLAERRVARKAKARPRAKSPAVQEGNHLQKAEKWVQWLVARRLADAYRQREQFIDGLLATAQTPLEVAIVEQTLEAYEIRWTSEVLNPLLVEATEKTFEAIELLWRSPTSEPGSPGQDDVPALPTAAPVLDEAPPTAFPANTAPFSPESHCRSSVEPTTLVEIAPNAEAGPSSRFIPHSNPPPSLPSPSVVKLTRAAPLKDSPEALPGPSMHQSTPAVTALLASPDLQEEDLAPTETVTVLEVEVVEQKPPMSLRSGLQVAWHPKSAPRPRRKAKAAV